MTQRKCTYHEQGCFVCLEPTQSQTQQQKCNHHPTVWIKAYFHSLPEREREGSNGQLAGRAAAAGDGLGESKLPHMAPPGKPNHLPWNHLQLEKDDDGGQRMETPFNTKKHPQQEQVPQTHPQEQP